MPLPRLLPCVGRGATPRPSQEPSQAPRVAWLPASCPFRSRVGQDHAQGAQWALTQTPWLIPAALTRSPPVLLGPKLLAGVSDPRAAQVLLAPCEGHQGAYRPSLHLITWHVPGGFPFSTVCAPHSCSAPGGTERNWEVTRASTDSVFPLPKSETGQSWLRGPWGAGHIGKDGDAFQEGVMGTTECTITPGTPPSYCTSRAWAAPELPGSGEIWVLKELKIPPAAHPQFRNPALQCSVLHRPRLLAPGPSASSGCP